MTVRQLLVIAALTGMGVVTLPTICGAQLLPGTTEIRAGDVPEESPADFKLRKEETRASIELWEQRVKKKVEHINQLLRDPQLNLQKIEGQKITVKALGEVLDDLDEEATAIVAAHEQIGVDLKLYRESIERAPGVFRQISEQFDQRATEESDLFLQQAYAEFAAESRKLASSYEGKAAGVEALEADIAKKMAFVQKSRKFIGEVRGFLAAIPTDHGLETEKLVVRINQYIDVFQQAIDAIRGVTNKIGEPAPTGPMPMAKPVTPLSLNAIPQNDAEFQRRLLALQRG